MTLITHARMGQMIANPDATPDIDVFAAKNAIRNGSYTPADFAAWGITATQYCNGMFALSCRLAAISHGATLCAETLAMASHEARIEQRRLDRIDDGAGF